MSTVKVFLLKLLLSISIIAQTTFDNGLISFKYDYEPLHSVLKDIKNKTGINFIYSDNLVRNYRVSCVTNQTALDDAIKNVLTLPNLAYKEFNNYTYVLFKRTKRSKKPYGTIITKQTDVADIDSTVVLTHPELIYRKDPFYPLLAIKNNIQGKVGVNLLINKGGSVIKTIVKNSSGYSILDEAAIAYSHELKFSPALLNNKPIDIWLSMVFKYKLE